MSGFTTGNKLRTGPRGEPINNTTITTNSLKLLDLADPKPEDICIEDIAHGLSQHVRWAGQGGWLSVAQHSVAAMRLIEQYGAAWHYPHDEWMLRKVLMHDAHEAYIGDFSGGLKYLLRDGPLERLIDKLDTVIQFALPGLDLTFTNNQREALDWAEETMVPSEYNLLFQGVRSSYLDAPLCPPGAKALFLQEAERLGLMAGSVDSAAGGS